MKNKSQMLVMNYLYTYSDSTEVSDIISILEGLYPNAKYRETLYMLYKDDLTVLECAERINFSTSQIKQWNREIIIAFHVMLKID